MVSDEVVDLVEQPAPVGVRVRHREDEAGVAERPERREQLRHLVRGGRAFERDRVKGHQQVARQ